MLHRKHSRYYLHLAVWRNPKAATDIRQLMRCSDAIRLEFKVVEKCTVQRSCNLPRLHVIWEDNCNEIDRLAMACCFMIFSLLLQVSKLALHVIDLIRLLVQLTLILALVVLQHAVSRAWAS